jgi:6-phosphogluconolactonase (cycloisomerase 2 family)
MPKALFYQSIGATLTRFDIDVDRAALTRREPVTAPANVQYVWPHPSRKFLYVVSSDGGPGKIPSTLNVATAYRIEPATGVLRPHGPAATLPSRPIHCCIDASGQFLLTAYNFPSNITVHRINPDGTIGAAVEQGAKLDFGIFAHQVMPMPGNTGVILVTRGNNATANRPEDPGALKLFGFKDGVLSNLLSVAPGRGLGFGPRHLDFHPIKPWVLLSVERQSQLMVYHYSADGSLSIDPTFTKSSLEDPASQGPSQMAGAIHVHPTGRFVYQTNRNSSTVVVGGRRVFKGGENNVAVFALNPTTGEPTLIQNAEARTNHLRTFAIDPSGRLLIAASIQPIPLEDGSTLPAALVLYRIGTDGKLTFVRKYDIDTGKLMQFWTGIVALE